MSIKDTISSFSSTFRIYDDVKFNFKEINVNYDEIMTLVKNSQKSVLAHKDAEFFWILIYINIPVTPKTTIKFEIKKASFNEVEIFFESIKDSIEHIPQLKNSLNEIQIYLRLRKLSDEAISA